MSIDAYQVEPPKSTYLQQQLPLVMAADRGLTNFLQGLDEMASELYERAGQKEFLFDVGTAPLSIVRLRARQIGVPIDSLLPDADQRRIARAAAATFPHRGTAHSLQRNLEALTGTSVTIDDPTDIEFELGTRLAEPRPVGESRPLRSDDSNVDPPSHPTVTIGLPSLGDATTTAVRSTVQREMGCAVTVKFVPPLPEPDETEVPS